MFYAINGLGYVPSVWKPGNWKLDETLVSEYRTSLDFGHLLNEQLHHQIRVPVPSCSSQLASYIFILVEPLTAMAWKSDKKVTLLLVQLSTNSRIGCWSVGKKLQAGNNQARLAGWWLHVRDTWPLTLQEISLMQCSIHSFCGWNYILHWFFWAHCFVL